MAPFNSILLIEDDPIATFLATILIKKELPHNSFISHNSAEKAIKYIKEQYLSNNPCPDLIFLDLNMVGMDGLEFIEELYKLDCNIKTKLIAVTNLFLREKPNPNLSFPIDFIIEKPITSEKLKVALSAIGQISN